MSNLPTYDFWLGGPDPQMGILSPGCVGAFCRIPKVPTFDESRSAKFCTVFEIFEVKVLPFSPHSVTTDEVSAPQQCHMVGVAVTLACSLGPSGTLEVLVVLALERNA